eukprot:341287_1
MTPNIHHKTMDKLSLAGFEETRITVSPTDMERVEEHIDAFVEPEMKRTDPLQDETYDEVIAHNDDEADKRLETAKSDIDDLYDDNKTQEIFDQIELQIELKQQITEQSLLNSSSEA